MSVRRFRPVSAAVLIAGGTVLALASTASAAPPVFASGQFVTPASYLLDLDHGQAQQTAGGEDAWFEVVSHGHRLLNPSGGGSFVKFGSTQPTYMQCRNATIVGKIYDLTKNVDKWFCAATNGGRVDRFKIISVNDSQLVLKFTTWSQH